jgi:hypothetical protein
LTRWVLIALMLAGCAGPEFRTVCILPPIAVTVFSSEAPKGSVDIWTGRLMGISGWQEKDGKMIDFYVAGHELQHLLRFHCGGFVDPDRR